MRSRPPCRAQHSPAGAGAGARGARRAHVVGNRKRGDSGESKGEGRGGCGAVAARGRLLGRGETPSALSRLPRPAAASVSWAVAAMRNWGSDRPRAARPVWGAPQVPGEMGCTRGALPR